MRPLPPAPLTPLERREFDTSGLEDAIAFAEATVRQTRRTLEALRPAAPPAAPLPALVAASGGTLAAAIEPEPVRNPAGKASRPVLQINPAQAE